MIAAILVSLHLLMGPGSIDSLEVQRASQLGPWAPATAWAVQGLLYTPPASVADGESLTVQVVQSMATDSRNTYRARTWAHGACSPWSSVAGIVTAARDTSYTLMSQSGALLPGAWVWSHGSIVLPQASVQARSDSTVRCVSQRDVQTYWYAAILRVFGYVR